MAASEDTPIALIVSADDPFIAEVEDASKDLGYRVLREKEEAPALQAIRQEPRIEVIIAGTQLTNGGRPGSPADGVSFLKKVRSLDPERPLFFFVADRAEINDNQAYSLGADAVFFKPIAGAILAATIRQILERVREQTKRRYERLRLADSTVQFNAISETSAGQNFEGHGIILNISSGGMFIFSRDLIPRPGSTVTFHWMVGDAKLKEFRGKGIVKWCRPEGTRGWPSGFGLQFTEVNPTEVDILTKEIAKKQEQPKRR